MRRTCWRRERPGRRVTCLAELVLRRAAVPVVGVTGTAGKTTACHRLAALLEAAGRPYAMARTARAANAWPDADLYERRRSCGRRRC